MSDGPMPHHEPDRIDSIDGLRGVIADSDRVLVVGNRSKPPLSIVAAGTRTISLAGLSGITEYEPSEFTFTALAGTTIAELNRVLADKRQYLPFDPMLVDEQATLGGTVAAGLSGPGRHRYGGVRDFILGVEFIAGDGALIRAGGKVVKNAAGFDIPKLLVGSCGRLGAITAMTFKVFPRADALHSYQIELPSHAAAFQIIATLARGRWELDAIDYHADARTVWIRIGGSAEVCTAIAKDIHAVLGTSRLTEVDADAAQIFWQNLRSLRWAGDAQRSVAKVPTDQAAACLLAEWCDETAGSVSAHVSVAGAACWLAFSPDALPEVDHKLAEVGRTGMLVRGEFGQAARIFVGRSAECSLQAAVKNAMDPPGRFPSLPA